MIWEKDRRQEKKWLRRFGKASNDFIARLRILEKKADILIKVIQKVWVRMENLFSLVKFDKNREGVDEVSVVNDIGSKRIEDDFELVSDEEVVVSDKKDPFHRWFNSRQFTDSDKKQADSILFVLFVVLLM